MEHTKELTLKDLMQISHDMEELQKDLNMLIKSMDVDELRTVLKIEKESAHGHSYGKKERKGFLLSLYCFVTI